MNTARRTFLLTAMALVLAVAGGCAKGATSVDTDLTEAAGGPLDADNDFCGNGFIDEDQDEECDPGDNEDVEDGRRGEKLGRATCQTLGFTAGGTLTCDPETCIYDTSLCKLPPVMSSGGNGG
jgi:hypothetical protein